MESDAGAVARHHSGTAILALIMGAAAVFSPVPFNTPVALFAVLLAWKARGELRSNPHVRGTIASLTGFLLAAGVLVVAFITFWLPLIIGTVVMAWPTWP